MWWLGQWSIRLPMQVVQSLGWEDTLEKEMATTLVFLPGEFHGQRSMVGYSPWGCKELDMTEWLILSLSHVGGRWVRGGAGFGCTVFRFWVLRVITAALLLSPRPSLLTPVGWGGPCGRFWPMSSDWSEVYPRLSRALSGPRWPTTLKMVVLHQLGSGLRRQKHSPLGQEDPLEKEMATHSSILA